MSISVIRGEAPLVLSLPHTGTEIPPTLEARFVSAWRARRDADWYVDQLYGFAAGLGATVIRTRWSRSVIDVNRDPAGISLYPGLATTELCPTTTFDGELLYVAGQQPDAADIAERRTLYYDPYHAHISAELRRLHALHRRVVLYDAHSIRSRIPRLFDGVLPHFNIGTNSGASCDSRLTTAVESACTSSSEFTRITNGRFKGGAITRTYGRPAEGIHAIQMELSCRGYLEEPDSPTERNWPPPYDPSYAAPMARVLEQVLAAALDFAKEAP